MKHSLHWGQRLLSFLTIAGAVGALAISARADKPADKPGANANATTYSGQATAVRIEGARNAGPIIIADTGALAAAGGALDASDSNVNIVSGAMTLAHGDAQVNGGGPETASAASATSFHVEVAMYTGNITIDADYIAASASASTNPGGHTAVDSSVTIQHLTVNGQVIAVTGAANQHVNLANDTRLIINEQVSSTAKGSADIDVTALHFWACDIEGRVCHIQSGITTSGTPPPPEEHTCGKVTGGGWITGTPSGAKGTFGMSGGVRRGAFWGHLTYIDHGTGMQVKSTAVTGFEVDATNANGRIITYAV